MKKRLRIYIAGPYSADNIHKGLKNIRKGIEFGYELLLLGFAPFVPWLDYHFCLMDKEDFLVVQDFYDYSMEWLKVSDAILVQGDWTSSKGTLEEIRVAEEMDIPVFYELEDLCNFAAKEGYKLNLANSQML